MGVEFGPPGCLENEIISALIAKKAATVAVAMSGGVDSTVTAALLLERGIRVRGVFMDLFRGARSAPGGRAREMAARLGIELEVIDLTDEFERLVLDYFRESYRSGLTPNPCVVCNRAIKFGLLLERVRAGGSSCLATGHYVKKIEADDGSWRLGMGRDPAKDQSYFLCRLSQEQLAGCLFPLGGLLKDEVYGLAADLGLGFERSEESQDVCFLEGRKLADYLSAAGLPGRPGEIVDRTGRCLGRHPGIHQFTIGQRRGLGIPDATPYYVVGLRPDTDRVVVGRSGELWHRRLALDEINWIAGNPPVLPADLMVKLRYRQPPAAARLLAGDDGGLEIAFRESQRAITPGQYAVIYQGDILLGGGPVQRVLDD